MLVGQGATVDEKGGNARIEKGGDANHGLPCGSAQQPLEAPAGLRL